MHRATSSLARRAFLQANAAVTLSAVVPFRLPSPCRATLRKLFPNTEPTTTLRDPRVKAIALQAIDAARTAGAQYADVRMTNTISRSAGAAPFATDPTRGLVGPGQIVELGLSVRALVNGHWGWVATPVISSDEAVRVARLATQFATATATREQPRPVDLGTIPVVHDGEWATSVKIDPFTLDPVDIQEWMYGMGAALADLVAARGQPGMQRSAAWSREEHPTFLFNAGFEKQERLFASTEGSFLTQTIITVNPILNIPYVSRSTSGAPPTLTFYNSFEKRVQAGFEYFTESPLLDIVRQAMDTADATPIVKPKPVDIGRYDCVFGAMWMAQLLNMTLAPAAEVDRVLGYEANASGTSYLGTDPLAILGTPVASPLVTITAERSNSIGMATAKWDDEGVATQDFTLIKDGVLVNYPTTREHASWIAPWTEKQGHPVRSLGCARAPSALYEPMQHTPNLNLHPGTGTATEDSLVAELEHGLHISNAVNVGSATVDWQGRNIFIFPLNANEIRNGKVVGSTLNSDMALTINADQLWKHLQALGGPASALYTNWNPPRGFGSTKGNPSRSVEYSIGAVPARVAQLALIRPAKQ